MHVADSRALPDTAARLTRKPCYFKVDRAKCPIYGWPEKFREFQWLRPRLLIPKSLFFVVINRVKVCTKFEVRSFTGSWDNK